jgi:MFS family permease
MFLTKRLPALGHASYRAYFLGQAISFIGSWMQQFALAWLVFRLTHSPTALGIVTFLGQIPMLLLSGVGGKWADRRDRRSIVIATQILSICQALALAALVGLGAPRVEWLYGLAVMLGVVAAFEAPARQALLLSFVDGVRADLPNAVALNSLLINVARLAGPALGGLIIHLWGEAPCFAANAFSYVFFLAIFLTIRPRASQKLGEAARAPTGYRELFADHKFCALVVLAASLGLFGAPFMALLPVLASKRYDGGAMTFGMLAAAAGFGALAGSLFVAVQLKPSRLQLLMRAGYFGAVAALALFALSSGLASGLTLLCLLGGSLVVAAASINSLVQIDLADEVRGRAVGVFTAAFFGTGPVGSLITSALADAAGIEVALLLDATACFLGGIGSERFVGWLALAKSPALKPNLDRRA